MLHRVLEDRLQKAVSEILPEAKTASVLVRPCPDPKFGDYQTNSLMSLAKERKMNPRQLAEQVKAKLDVADICENIEIAGAGFLNFRVKTSAIEQTLQAAARGEHLFFQKTDKPRSVVVDFSSPNVAKPMHVGHIRSTILGDSLARVLRLLGHKVVTDNHIGDWGTQFGKLLVGWKHLMDRTALQKDAIEELEWIYKIVNFCSEASKPEVSAIFNFLNAFDETQSPISKWWNDIRSLPTEAFHQLCTEEKKDSPIPSEEQDAFKTFLRTMWKLGSVDKESAVLVPNGKANRLRGFLAFCTSSEVLTLARQELVKLQSGDEENLRIWHEMIALSQKQFDAIYGRLGIKFDVTLGESFYNPWLKEVVGELSAKSIAKESEGALCIFSDGKVPQKEDPFLIQRDGKWNDNPALIQKSDGGFNYATTDLATLRYRLQTWNPQEIIYVTDGRQQLHFRQVFSAFQRWHPEAKIKLAHVWFGSILGEDGKPFKTRSGDTVKLAELLDEAEERSLKVVADKNPELPETEQKNIARIVGLGSVKYADLQQNRQSDYVFSWDKMLSLEGNTAPYLLYAYARIRSIFRKAGDTGVTTAHAPIRLNQVEEIALARHLLNFGLVLEAMAEDYRPNFLCSYLYDLASFFAQFYRECPVLKAEESQRASRLTLCDLTARVLKQGLEVLGIETAEQM